MRVGHRCAAPAGVVAAALRDRLAAFALGTGALQSVQSVQKSCDVVVWQLQAAKQHFSELVERARQDGPQVVTKHGKDAVVVVSAEEYRRLRGGGPSLVEFIRSAPDFDALDLDRSPDDGRDIEL